ncbi:MAG: HlyD family efflux transporter periplasmic adaptor subunit, partial [Proteobacteria bacterium]
MLKASIASYHSGEFMTKSNIPLFRKEAVDEQNDNGLGEVLLIVPMRLKALIVVIGTFGILICFGLWYIKFTKTERVEGTLRLTKTASPIESPIAGRIKHLLVKNGDEVKQGQVLAILDITNRNTAGEPVLSAYEIKAESSGRIASLRANVGDKLDEGDQFLKISPTDTELGAEIFVPANVMPFVKSGSKIWLQYDAFPANSYGLFQGTVDSISGEMMSPQDMQIFNVRSPSYIIQVKLDDQTVKGLNENFTLNEGISLHSDLPLSTRR